MGTYINIGNAGFQRVRNGEYVDKSGLIAVVNSTLFTERSFSCVTRCRRFGKSLVAKMLAAYYDRSVDSRSLFADLQIASDPSFEQHLNNFGFTKDEVRALAARHGMDFDELEMWYDGYQIGVIHRELPSGKGFAEKTTGRRAKLGNPGAHSAQERRLARHRAGAEI